MIVRGSEVMKRLNPLDDFVFKKLLGEKGSEEELLSFLNAVLKQEDEDRLVSVEIIENKELTRQLVMDKGGRLDVRARTSDGTQLDIEVQLQDQQNMDKRTLFYWGKLFLEGIQKGEDYQKLKKVITINLLDFDFLDIRRFHSSYHLWEDHEESYLLTDLLEVHFIEMPKFRRVEEKEPKKNPLHRWLLFLDKTVDEEKLKELMEMDTAIKRAEARLEHISSDDETLALYEARQNARIEYNSAISSAERKGRMEEKKEIARSLLDILDEKTIADKTGLSIDEVRKLRALQ